MSKEELLGRIEDLERDVRTLEVVVGVLLA